MHITCPACAAAYEVPDTLLVPGRRARCSRCGHEWEPSADTTPPPPEPEATPAVTAVVAPESAVRIPEAPRVAAAERRVTPSAKPPRRRPGAAIWLGWAASLAIVVYAGYAAAHHRETVMRRWPPSVRLYNALGLLPAAPPAKP